VETGGLKTQSVRSKGGKSKMVSWGKKYRGQGYFKKAQGEQCAKSLVKQQQGGWGVAET